MEPNLQQQKIEILNLDGKIVKIFNHKPGSLVSIQRKKLPSGSYYLRIQGDQTYLKRVTVD
jgi:hypothetical protein